MVPKPTMGTGGMYMVFLVFFVLLRQTAETELDEEAASTQGETQSLLEFKSLADPKGYLGNWGNTSNPCEWTGVSCTRGHVSKLVLEEFGLAGSIHPLLGLKSLRVLSLKNNALNGSLPTDLGSWKNLRFLFLGGNRLSGTIPNSISLVTRLWRLDLSENRLTGPIPASVGLLINLLTLRLEGNGLSSDLPDSLGNLTSLQDFNVSRNRLTGFIPSSLSRFNSSAYLGNVHLCGSPLPITSCLTPSPAPSPGASPSLGRRHAPTRSPTSSSENSTTPVRGKRGNKLSTGAIIAIVVGDTVVLLVMTCMFLFYYWNKYNREHQHPAILSSSGKAKSTVSNPVTPYDHDHCRSSSASSVAYVSAANTKLVFFTGPNEGRGSSFDLEDLLRASAEMLGKGSLGSVYKAVLEDGCVVAVKRLKEVASSSRREFEQHMEMIGKMRSPNLVRLRAYYYAKDEKLLVYDYMPTGSLHTLLHGNRGPGRVPVDWTTRMKIALGAARGLAYIHQEGGSHKIPHGNIKSSNILLDKNGVACVGDFGLALLMNSAACSRLVGYRAPEHSETRRISQKGDVYSFGVLLLEILTGKSPVQPVVEQLEEGACGIVDLPRWVQSVVREEWTAEVFDLELMRYKNIEEEMVALLQIAMACVAQSPEARPKMREVVRMVEDIRGDISPARDDSFDSQSQSSSMSEDGATSH